MLFDYISELSVKLLDAVATRQVGGRECTSYGALIKHSQDASFSLCWIKKKKCVAWDVFWSTPSRLPDSPSPTPTRNCSGHIKL